MNRLFFLCLLCSVAVNGFVVSPVSAAGSGEAGHAPVDKVLEYSIERLKSSVQKSLQNNDRLSFENAMLEKSVKELEAFKESLLSSRAALTGEADGIVFREAPLSPEIVNMADRERRTQELIITFRRDIDRNQEKLQGVEKHLDAAGFQKYKKSLLNSEGRSVRDLAVAQQKLTDLQNRNAKVVSQIESLTRMQNELISKVERLQARLRGF